MNNCFERDIYESAKRKIEEFNKNVKYYYIEGPKGEKGEQGIPGERGANGPTTIEVGLTETIDSTEPASVANTGTNQDVILNFKIPRGIQGIEGKIGPTGPKGEKGIQGEQGEKGEKGEKGDIGPRGLPGEIGISQVITVDGTETIEPGELASVHDDFEHNVHHLTFYIPKGEKGESAVSPRIVYGERFLNTSSQLQLTQDVETVVPLKENGPGFNLGYDTENAIDIRETNFYLISYYFSATPTIITKINLKLQSNDTPLPSSNISTTFEPNKINNVSNTILATLQADEKLTLIISSDTDATLNFNALTNVVLTVVKVH